MESVKLKTPLDAVTATTTSDAMDVKYAKKITFLFTRSNHSSGSSTFTVEGSIDGSTYVALNKLVTNVTNTNAQTPVRVASVALSANGSAMVSLDMQYDAYTHIKVTVTEVTDGTHTAKCLITY